jgi:hypothetical protein
MRRSLALSVALLLIGTGAWAQDTTAPMAQETPPAALQPIFESHDIVPMVLEVEDLKKLIRDVGEENEDHAATLTYVDANGDSVSLAIEVETRGHFRRDRKNCNFPPIRFEFPDSGTEQTLFAGQGNVKLVAHCQDKRDEYEQYVLQEYLIYRIYNLISDRSFRVRLAQITYLDGKGERDPLTKYGFMIEDHDLMAARNQCTTLEVQAHPLEFSPLETARMAIFQYMVANTDWSIAYLHNVRLLMCGDYEPVAVPYDFDWSGVMKTRYAKPDPKLGIRSVRDRLFRGFCRDEAIFQEATHAFVEHKDAIYALYQNQQDLDPKVLTETMKFYDKFYEIVENPKKFKREIIDECRRQ